MTITHKAFQFSRHNILKVLLLLLSLAIVGCADDSSSDDDDNTNTNTNTSTCSMEVASQAGWTMMVYLDADNDLEEYAMADVKEMKAGIDDAASINLIILVDRINGYSDDATALGENFTGTRLYQITNGAYQRLEGCNYLDVDNQGDDNELNMGDADNLKNFVDYTKNYFPADNYALILWNHGNGVRSKSDTQKSTRGDYGEMSICSDETDGDDILYTAEITDTLTSSQSVELLGFDACLMGSVELAYQFNPSNNDFNADYIVASPPTEWGYGWEYESILTRFTTTSGDNGTTSDVGESGNESYYNPATMTAKNVCEVIVEEQYDETTAYTTSQALSCYDNSKVTALKSAIDALAVSLNNENELSDFESVRGSLTAVSTIHYFDETSESEWISAPYFDVYDLADRINTDASGYFSNTIETNAGDVMTATDNMVVYSFAGSDYSGFTGGKHGIHIFAPDGDRDSDGYGHWAYQWWYNAIDTSEWWDDDHLYGKLAWCIDDAVANDATVTNWFEFLDNSFDSTGTANGYTP